MQTNKQKLIDLAIKSFKSSDFEFIKKRKTEGNNKIHVNSFSNFDLVIFTESTIMLDYETYKNTKVVSIPNFTFSIRFGEPRRILKLNFRFIHPSYGNMKEYEITKTKRSIWVILNPFKSNWLKTYTLKKDIKAFYIKCGKVKEYLTIEEYIDLATTLKEIYEDRIKTYEVDIINKDINAVEQALINIQ